MRLSLKDPGSAITHFAAVVMVLIAGTALLLHAGKHFEPVTMISLLVFIVTMIMLYAASTLYHSLDIGEKVNMVLKKLDHMMIFVMIAGSYTPICVISLEEKTGKYLCLAVWLIAVAGVLVKALWINCPKWFSSILYIAMGWTCIFAMPQIYNSLSPSAFGWLLTGGIIYTLGGVIYALKIPVFEKIHKYFGTHEVFHLLVMAGSGCHFITMFLIS